MADIAMLSILWTICSIPVITMGAASAALMRCVLNMNTEEGNWRSRHFFRYFRSQQAELLRRKKEFKEEQHRKYQEELAAKKNKQNNNTAP